jgi:HlyD family secretion protein
MVSKHAQRAMATALLTSALLLTSCNNNTPAADANARNATLGTGSLTATVSATGNIQAESDVKLSFQQPGIVAEVVVKVGDAVKKDDVLAKLDTTDLELSFSQAQAAVLQAQTAIKNAEAQVIVATAGYSRTVNGARPADIAAARAALASASENYNKVKAGPTTEDLASVEAALKNAEASLKQAQSAYDRAYGQNPAAIGASPAAVQLEQATNNYNAAKSNYDKVAKGADSAQLSAAQQQVQSARAQLDKVLRPAQQFDIEQAKAQIEQAKLQVQNAQTQLKLAEIQVKQAQRRLDLAVVKAPIDGMVSLVNTKVGETVGTQPVLGVVDLSQYHIDITVDEIDVAKVQLGQEVDVTLDSLPGVEVKGKVDRIAPTATTVNGVVSYNVRVLINKTEAPLKTGMTSNASIVLEKRENVLLAPNWAVRRDRLTGKSFLTLQTGEQTQEIEIKTGLRNDTFSEVLSGAQAGQVVVAPRAPVLGQ